MKRALVLGAGGFIGHHLVSALKTDGYFVRGVDLKKPDFGETSADEFMLRDLRDQSTYSSILDIYFDEIYQLAADMGGAGYIFTGENDASIMSSSALININLLRRLSEIKTGKIFYSSSACIYPQENQEDPDEFTCEESTAYPANPDSNYGWEKLFSERLFFSYAANYKLDVSVGRYHNIYGPLCCYDGGKEKAPAAISRKVGEIADRTGEVEVWGDGKQTRSFLYIDDCIAATRKLLESNFAGPVNIGSEEKISINSLVELVGDIAGKDVSIKHVSGPQGVRGRSSDNKLIEDKLAWQPSVSLRVGMTKTYQWVEKELKDSKIN